MSSRDTRRRILEAAQCLIESGGFTRLTTREVARKAGCAEGTIFKHFERKDDLCLAVVLENAPRFKEALAKKRAGKATVQKNLEDIALAAIQFSGKLIPLAAALFADANLLMRHRETLTQTGGGPKEAFDLIAAYISAEQKLGRINRSATPLSVSALLFGPCFYWAFIQQAMGRNLLDMTDREFARHLVATLTRGLSSTPHLNKSQARTRSKA
jgi:AcrR family transcriptional regulator